MPRTKAESTADAVEEQKTDAVEDTAPVQAEEPKANQQNEHPQINEEKDRQPKEKKHREKERRANKNNQKNNRKYFDCFFYVIINLSSLSGYAVRNRIIGEATLLSKGAETNETI